MGHYTHIGVQRPTLKERPNGMPLRRHTSVAHHGRDSALVGKTPNLKLGLVKPATTQSAGTDSDMQEPQRNDCHVLDKSPLVDKSP